MQETVKYDEWVSFGKCSQTTYPEFYHSALFLPGGKWYPMNNEYAETYGICLIDSGSSPISEVSAVLTRNKPENIWTRVKH